MSSIIIGSRGSDLALWQANFVKSELENLGCNVTIKIIKTQGDQIQHLSFDKLEGKGFFTKELEEELLQGTIDLAVHSHKDLETNQPDGLMIACVSGRANPADLLVINKAAYQPDHKWGIIQNAVVGTSSARRKVQLLHHRNDFQIKDLRGNVPTRIDKLKRGEYDAIMLAKAGVDRLKLDLSDFITTEMSPEEFVPAPAQGVLGLQIRKKDTELAVLLQKLDHPEVAKRINLERKVLNLLEGGCQLPLGAFCSEKALFVSFAASASSQNHYKKYEFSEQFPDPVAIVEELKSLS